MLTYVPYFMAFLRFLQRYIAAMWVRLTVEIYTLKISKITKIKIIEIIGFAINCRVLRLQKRIANSDFWLLYSIFAVA